MANSGTILLQSDYIGIFWITSFLFTQLTVLPTGGLQMSLYIEVITTDAAGKSKQAHHHYHHVKGNSIEYLSMYGNR